MANSCQPLALSQTIASIFKDFTISNFRTLKIWKKGIELVIEVYNLSRKLPDEEKYGLKSQITRAAISIPSNIAEGSSRSSDKEYKHFLEVALGSAFELETHLIIIQELKMIDNKIVATILNALHEEQKMMNTFIQRLK